MKNTVTSISLAVALVFAVAMLFTTAAEAKKGKGERPYIAPTITAEQAISTVKTSLSRLTAGKSFVKTGKRGESNLEVVLVLDGKIVSRIRLNPATGEILSKGQKVMVQQVSASKDQAVKIVQQAIPNLEVASVQLGKEGEWKVDLTLRKAVVATINVHGGDGSILPDWKAFRDASMY